MDSKAIPNEKNYVKSTCPVTTTMGIIGGKWKPIILFVLQNNSNIRFGEMKRLIPGITQKMLTQQLRELEKDGIVNRKVYAVVPPKVEYSLTEEGHSLEPLLQEMCSWGNRHLARAK